MPCRPWGDLQFTNFMHSCFKTLFGLRTGQGICIDHMLLMYRILFKAPYLAVPSQRPFSQSSYREEWWAISRGSWRLNDLPKGTQLRDRSRRGTQVYMAVICTPSTAHTDPRLQDSRPPPLQKWRKLNICNWARNLRHSKRTWTLRWDDMSQGLGEEDPTSQAGSKWTRKSAKEESLLLGFREWGGHHA